MAKYSVTHSCGHEQTHNICGPQHLRQGKADWLAEGVCSECYRAEQKRLRDEKRAQHAEENQKAAAANQGAGLPGLEGSEKQIAWAESIRAALLPEAERCLAEYDQAEKDGKFSEAQLPTLRRIQAILGGLPQVISAKAWIEGGRDRQANPKLLMLDIRDYTQGEKNDLLSAAEGK